MPLLTAKKSRRFLDSMLKKHDRLMNKAVGAYTRKVETRQPIHPEYAASLLDQVAAEDAIFTADTGMCNVWTARYINPLGTRRLIGSYLHGSMANALPHAIGAQLAYPGRQVSRYRATAACPCCWASSSRSPRTGCRSTWWCSTTPRWAWSSWRCWWTGSRTSAWTCPDANYAAVARALGFHAVRVTDPSRIEAAYREAFAHPGPSLVELITDPKALSLPPKIKGAQVLGFATAMSKVVLNRGAGEAVSMARSNLRNIPRR